MGTTSLQKQYTLTRSPQGITVQWNPLFSETVTLVSLVPLVLSYIIEKAVMEYESVKLLQLFYPKQCIMFTPSSQEFDDI